MADTTKNPFGLNNNKYFQAYNKYSPYLKFLNGMSQGGNAGKAAAEAGLDYGMRNSPLGPVYTGVKTFNDMTGGINFNKMFHVKNPFTSMWNGMWGTKPKSQDAVNNEDPDYIKFMSMLSADQNANAAAERAALEKKQQIQPMQEKAVNDYMDILQNGLSSRQLAPIYAAGEARNRAIGAGAEAGLMSQVANRGMGGGIQAGLEAAVQANRNALSADLNSRITGQQIAARPGMLGQAANFTMGMENQVQQELAQAAMNRLNAANVGLQAYNQNQYNKRLQAQLDAEKSMAREQEYGALLGKFGPDIAKGLKTLFNKPGQPEPIEVAPQSNFNGVDANGDWLGTSSSDSPIADWSQTGWRTKVSPSGNEYQEPINPDVNPLHTMNDVSIPPLNTPLNTRAADFYMLPKNSPNIPASLLEEQQLNMNHPFAMDGDSFQGPNGAMYTRQQGKWIKSYRKQAGFQGSARPFGIF